MIWHPDTCDGYAQNRSCALQIEFASDSWPSPLPDGEARTATATLVRIAQRCARHAGMSDAEIWARFWPSATGECGQRNDAVAETLRVHPELRRVVEIDPETKFTTLDVEWFFDMSHRLHVRPVGLSAIARTALQARLRARLGDTVDVD